MGNMYEYAKNSLRDKKLNYRAREVQLGGKTSGVHPNIDLVLG